LAIEVLGFARPGDRIIVPATPRSGPAGAGTAAER
jgi:hypothetical protein